MARNLLELAVGACALILTTVSILLLSAPLALIGAILSAIAVGMRLSA